MTKLFRILNYKRQQEKNSCQDKTIRQMKKEEKNEENMTSWDQRIINDKNYEKNLTGPKKLQKYTEWSPEARAQLYRQTDRHLLRCKECINYDRLFSGPAYSGLSNRFHIFYANSRTTAKVK